MAEYLSANETDQLVSPIVVERKREFVFIFFFCLSLLIFFYRRKPSSKVKYMQKPASIDAASVNDDSIHSVRYCSSCFVFH